MERFFLFGNSSILGILIASIILFVIAFSIPYFNKIHSPVVFLAFLVSIGCLLFLVTQSRAACIGFTCSSLFLCNRLQIIKSHWRKFMSFAIPISAGLMTLMLFLKSDSSKGRLLIYRISANLFARNYVHGIGLGQFKERYNEAQAAYFSTHGINSNEALLADNTFYAFNDIWQLLIELGIVKFSFLLILSVFLIRHFNPYPVLSNKKNLSNGATACLLCILVSSVLSYPFQVFGLQIIFVSCSGLLVSSLSSPSNKKCYGNILLMGSRIFCFTGVLFLCYHGMNRIWTIQKAKRAFELSQFGFKDEAIKLFTSLQHSRFNDGATLLAHSKLLYNMNRTEDAKTVLEEAKRRYVNSEMHKLSAAIAYEQGNVKQAEEDYLTAVYMVPNRMRSRYELMNFYLSVKDTTAAVWWAKSILQMPVKIPSETTEQFLKETKIVLSTIEKPSAKN